MNDIMKSKPSIKGSIYGLAAAWLLGGLLGFIGAMPVCAQNLSVTDSLIAGGGGKSTNATYAIAGTIGQPGAGVKMSAADFSVESGFWQVITLVQTPQAPVLQIARNGTQAMIFWDTKATGFVLEYTTSLRAPVNWQPAQGVSNNSMAITVPQGAVFFRLRPTQ